MRLLIALLAVSAAWAQVAAEANSRYSTPESRREWVARQVARIEDRVRTDKPQELVAALGLKPGMTVVDLGTGVGFMLPYFSAAVGPTGRVLAVDIFEDFLAAAKANAAKKLDNVDFILGNDKDPKIPLGKADLVFAWDAYHHFDYPEKTVEGVRNALKDGGRFAVVDSYKNDDPDHIRLDKADLIKEVEGFGFTLVSTKDRAGKRFDDAREAAKRDNEYIAIFTKR